MAFRLFFWDRYRIESPDSLQRRYERSATDIAMLGRGFISPWTQEFAKVFNQAMSDREISAEELAKRYDVDTEAIWLFGSNNVTDEKLDMVALVSMSLELGILDRMPREMLLGAVRVFRSYTKLLIRIGQLRTAIAYVGLTHVMQELARGKKRTEQLPLPLV